jgi:hypothetical protein
MAYHPKPWRRMVGSAGNAPVRRFRFYLKTPDLQSGNRIASREKTISVLGQNHERRMACDSGKGWPAIRSSEPSEQALLRPRLWRASSALSRRSVELEQRMVAGVGITPT